MKDGAAVRAMASEIGKTIAEADGLDPLKDISERLSELQNEVVATTMHLAGIGMGGDVHLYVANATAYLEMFSQMLMVWQLLAQAVIAQKALDSGTGEEEFYGAKIETARFYANQTVPHALATAKIIQSDERGALDFKPEWF
jgi:butyryl-CoA dehydrogenase